MHETDLSSKILSISSVNGNEIKILGIGGKRMAWKVVIENREKDALILKTRRFGQKFNGWAFESVRRDAIATEKLHSSPNVIDTFGFCGTSALNEIGYMGADIFFRESRSSYREVLRYAMGLRIP